MLSEIFAILNEEFKLFHIHTQHFPQLNSYFPVSAYYTSSSSKCTWPVRTHVYRPFPNPTSKLECLSLRLSDHIQRYVCYGMKEFGKFWISFPIEGTLWGGTTTTSVLYVLIRCDRHCTGKRAHRSVIQFVWLFVIPVYVRRLRRGSWVTWNILIMCKVHKFTSFISGTWQMCAISHPLFYNTIGGGMEWVSLFITQVIVVISIINWY